MTNSVCDKWFVDDGQVFVRPFQFDPFLRALDAAPAPFGATGGEVPCARQRQELRALLSVSMSLRCGTLRACTTPSTLSLRKRASQRWAQPLGLVSISMDKPKSLFAPATRCAPPLPALIMPPRRWFSPGNALTCPISCTTCVPTVTLLIKTCWLHLMDSCGPPSAPRCVAICQITPDHWGHLGLRTALGIALSAFVASRIMCRPLVSTMVDHFSLACGVPSQSIMAEYDTRTDAALTRLVSTLPPPAAQDLSGQLDEVFV